MESTAVHPDLSRYRQLDDAGRTRLLQDVRVALAGDAWEEVATELWADLLHDADHVVDVWTALTRPLPDGVVLARILDVSGPVPSAWKLPVLEALTADPGWHDPIIRALWFATFEDHGDIDVVAARELVVQLVPSIAASEHEDVTAALQQLPDDCRSYSEWQRRAEATVAAPTFASARAATELERRQGERRRYNAGPPPGVAERRRTPDRRGMWNTIAPVSADVAHQAVGEPAHVSPARVLIPLVAGSAVALACGAWASEHDPSGQALPSLVFSSTLSLKVWFTTAAAALGLLQLASSLRMFDVVRIPRAWPAWLPSVHRWTGVVAILLTLPVVYHCMWALGFQDYSTRVLAHSLLGCAFYGALVAKVVTRRAPNMPRHLGMPVFGGLLFATLTGLWLTSSLWFFRTVAFPGF